MSESQPIGDVLAALAFLPPDTSITITVTVAELREAIEARAGGPQLLTAELAADHLGRTPEFWRRAAASGEISGAWQGTERGRWQLPREACEAHLRSLQHRGRKARPSVPRPAFPFDAGRPRGPRKA